MEGTPKPGKYTHTQMLVNEPSATPASCREDFLACATLSQGFCGCLWAPRSPEGNLNFKCSPSWGLHPSSLPLPAEPGRHPQPASVVGARRPGRSLCRCGCRDGIRFNDQQEQNVQQQEWTWRALCSQRKKSDRERQILCDITYTWSLKNTTN